MLYVRFPLSLRNVEDLLHERGIDVSHEAVRYWWNRFGPIFAAEIRRNRASHLQSWPQWRWHLDEVFVRINGEIHYLWRAGNRVNVSCGKEADKELATVGMVSAGREPNLTMRWRTILATMSLVLVRRMRRASHRRSRFCRGHQRARNSARP
jgi:hypothetical protein